jgi:hypothetical protein
MRIPTKNQLITDNPMLRPDGRKFYSATDAGEIPPQDPPVFQGDATIEIEDSIGNILADLDSLDLGVLTLEEETFEITIRNQGDAALIMPSDPRINIIEVDEETGLLVSYSGDKYSIPAGEEVVIEFTIDFSEYNTTGDFTFGLEFLSNSAVSPVFTLTIEANYTPA